MTNYKKKIISERETIFKDELNMPHAYGAAGIKGSGVVVKDSITGKIYHKGSNSVLVPGALITAKAHIPRLNLPVKLPSYNSLLNLDNTTSEEQPIDQPRQIWLFCAGTNGGQKGSSIIYPVDRSKWIPKESLIPFRYCEKGSDIPSTLRDTYFGRKEYADYIAYYFKTFVGDPTCTARYKDGTIITPTMYTDSNVDPEIVVEIEFKITNDDCRDWFRVNSPGGINDAHVNTMSLLSAWYTIGEDGYKYFQDIQPITKFNFKTEDLDELDKGLDIIYYLYY